MGFEVFDKLTAAPTDEPTLGIQKSGVISLNRAAYRALGEPKAVELLFDRSRKVIGVRAAATTLPHAYAVRENSSGTSFLISGGAFTKHYGLPVDKARRWHASIQQRVLCADTTKSPIADRYST